MAIKNRKLAILMNCFLSSVEDSFTSGLCFTKNTYYYYSVSLLTLLKYVTLNIHAGYMRLPVGMFLHLPRIIESEILGLPIFYAILDLNDVRSEIYLDRLRMEDD